MPVEEAYGMRVSTSAGHDSRGDLVIWRGNLGMKWSRLGERLLTGLAVTHDAGRVDLEAVVDPPYRREWIHF